MALNRVLPNSWNGIVRSVYWLPLHGCTWRSYACYRNSLPENKHTKAQNIKGRRDNIATAFLLQRISYLKLLISYLILPAIAIEHITQTTQYAAFFLTATWSAIS